MRIEIHVLQNFAPSNLNRDDTGSPKDAMFGGHRRARISSQCIKRQVRWHPTLREELMAVVGNRSSRHAAAVERRLVGEPYSKDAAQARNVARYMFQKLGLKEDHTGRLTVLQFFGDDELAGITAAAAENWDTLAPAANARLQWDQLAARLTGFLDGMGEHAAMLGELIANEKAGKANAATTSRWLELPRAAWDPIVAAVSAIKPETMQELAEAFTPADADEKPDEDDDSVLVPKKAADLFKHKTKNKEVSEALKKLTLEKPKKGGATNPESTDAKESAKVIAKIFDPLQKLTTKAVDIALFGRMIAEIPQKKPVTAACQVAHAISTNALRSMESDYFTAVDDLKHLDERPDAGAGMIGTVEFNSACYYRYANLDVGQLRANLQGDDDLTRKAAGAFLAAFVHAVPTGKQNTFAAHSKPSLVLVTVRTGGPVSLANAFVQPVAPKGDDSLVERSIAALDKYYGELVKMYGDGGLVAAAVCRVGAGTFTNLKGAADGVAEVITAAITAAFPNGGGA